MATGLPFYYFFGSVWGWFPNGIGVICGHTCWIGLKDRIQQLWLRDRAREIWCLKILQDGFCVAAVVVVVVVAVAPSIRKYLSPDSSWWPQDALKERHPIFHIDLTKHRPNMIRWTANRLTGVSPGKPLLCCVQPAFLTTCIRPVGYSCSFAGREVWESQGGVEKRFSELGDSGELLDGFIFEFFEIAPPVRKVHLFSRVVSSNIYVDTLERAVPTLAIRIWWQCRSFWVYLLFSQVCVVCFLYFQTL